MTAPTTLERKVLPGTLLRVLILLGISVFINYIDRGNLSFAAPLLKDELNITPARLGFLLSAFFWTYAGMMPIYGWLVDKLNVCWLLAVCYFIWSAATAATGLVHGFALLFVLRLLVGMGESVSYPAYSKIIALNFSEEHRGIANAIIAAGLSLGPGFGMLLGGMLMSRLGWRTFFIGLGLISLLWLPPWIKWMPKRVHAPPSDSSGAPNLLEFLSMRSAWGSCLGLFAANYMNYFLLTWLPYYLVREQHYSMDNMAKLGAAAYLMSGISATVSGWLSDRWIVRGGTPTRVRKAFAGGALGMAGIVLAFCPFTGPFTCGALLLIGLTFFGAAASNVFAVSQRLAGPQAAGRWTGFQNAFGNLAGVVVPVVTGFIVKNTGSFQWAFVAVSVAALLGTASYYFVVGPVEQVTWRRTARRAVAVTA